MKYLEPPSNLHNKQGWAPLGTDSKQAPRPHCVYSTRPQQFCFQCVQMFEQVPNSLPSRSLNPPRPRRATHPTTYTWNNGNTLTHTQPSTYLSLWSVAAARPAANTPGQKPSCLMFPELAGRYQPTEHARRAQQGGSSLCHRTDN